MGLALPRSPNGLAQQRVRAVRTRSGKALYSRPNRHSGRRGVALFMPMAHMPATARMPSHTLFKKGVKLANAM